MYTMPSRNWTSQKSLRLSYNTDEFDVCFFPAINLICTMYTDKTVKMMMRMPLKFKSNSWSFARPVSWCVRAASNLHKRGIDVQLVCQEEYQKLATGQGWERTWGGQLDKCWRFYLGRRNYSSKFATSAQICDTFMPVARLLLTPLMLIEANWPIRWLKTKCCWPK